VDILGTNTGGPPAAAFLDLTEEQWASGVQSTLMNAVRMSRLVLPGMKARRWGRIIHITSLAAKKEGLSLDQAMEKGQAAIPMGRFGKPEEVGDVITFLCSERAGHLTGASLQVDGGIIQSTS
jgi:3-oxoacyl-[acyl-carrier protein] reductase